MGMGGMGHIDMFSPFLSLALSLSLTHSLSLSLSLSPCLLALASRRRFTPQTKAMSPKAWLKSETCGAFCFAAGRRGVVLSAAPPVHIDTSSQVRVFLQVLLQRLAACQP